MLKVDVYQRGRLLRSIAVATPSEAQAVCDLFKTSGAVLIIRKNGEPVFVKDNAVSYTEASGGRGETASA
jgi:hypothetical protein